MSLHWTLLWDSFCIFDFFVTQTLFKVLWSVVTISYGCDQIDRLVSEKRTGSSPYWYEYAYDGSGNRLGMVQRDSVGNIVGQKSYSYDLGNKLVQEVANGVTTVYQYDANGNTISKATGTSQVRYYWDDVDKMVRVEDSVVMNFKVDGLGFRRMKEVVGQGQTWFVYDMGERRRGWLHWLRSMTRMVT